MERVFYDFNSFNADISNWNTAAVTTMYLSTSTLVSVVSLEFHSLLLLFISRFYFWILSTPGHPPTAFQDASAFNQDISKWNTAAVTEMAYSTSTLVSVVSLEFHSLPLLFTFLLFLDSVHHTAPTSFFSVQSGFCLQPGSFQVEHCGGAKHV